MTIQFSDLARGNQDTKDGVSTKASASSMFEAAVQKTRAMDREKADREAFARALKKVR